MTTPVNNGSLNYINTVNTPSPPTSGTYYPPYIVVQDTTNTGSAQNLGASTINNEFNQIITDTPILVSTGDTEFPNYFMASVTYSSQQKLNDAYNILQFCIPLVSSPSATLTGKYLVTISVESSGSSSTSYVYTTNDIVQLYGITAGSLSAYYYGIQIPVTNFFSGLTSTGIYHKISVTGNYTINPF